MEMYNSSQMESSNVRKLLKKVGRTEEFLATSDIFVSSRKGLQDNELDTLINWYKTNNYDSFVQLLNQVNSTVQDETTQLLSMTKDDTMYIVIGKRNGLTIDIILASANISQIRASFRKRLGVFTMATAGFILWLYNFEISSLFVFGIAITFIQPRMSKKELVTILLLQELQKNNKLIIENDELFIC